MTGIMVVDDQAINRRVIAQLAAAVENDLKVITFSNPIDALAHAEDDAPDLLITDLKMDPIDGDEFIRRFRRVRACGDVPVIVVTAHREIELRDRAVQAGSTDFFISPVNHQEFKARSRQVLDQARKQKLERTWTGDIRDSDEPDLVDKAAADAALSRVREMMKAVSSQLALAVAEHESAKNDFECVLELSGLAAVFVDNNLLIRRFTTLATSVYQLGDTDIGKSLAALPANFKYGNFERDLARAVKLQEITEKYVTTRDDGLYRIRITPNRRKDGSTDGATIIFMKIDNQ